jgi:hypothetical protein
MLIAQSWFRAMDKAEGGVVVVDFMSAYDALYGHGDGYVVPNLDLSQLLRVRL